jgi:muramoyltetrapeptide carboxypeptidase
LRVSIGKTLNKKWQHFGGTDAERAADMQQLLDDKNISAILFGRGGYGAIRILDHSHIHTNFNIPTIHGTMACSFSKNAVTSTHTLHDVLFGKKIEYDIAGSPFNKPGKANGILTGGNLSLIYAMQASESELNTDGKILFIEDVGEQIYSIDRMLMNLKRSGKLEKLAGLIVGGFTNIKTDAKNDFTMSIEEIILEKIKSYNYPVCFNFPAGHQQDNRAFKLGLPYSLAVSIDSSWLYEQNHNTLSVIRLKDHSTTTSVDSNNISQNLTKEDW